jgi:hypothetical protein
LSGNQLAELIGLSQTTTLPNRLPKELKGILGQDFTVMPGFYKMESGGKTKLSLWSTVNAIRYIQYHAIQGNKPAANIMYAFGSTTLDMIINDSFNRDYLKGQAEATAKARYSGIEERNVFTAAIKAYIIKHSMSANYQKQSYSNATDAAYLGIFNRRASKLKSDWDCKNPRDNMTEKELGYVKQVEELAARLITQKDLEPVLAVIQALDSLIIPVQKR